MIEFIVIFKLLFAKLKRLFSFSGLQKLNIKKRFLLSLADNLNKINIYSNVLVQKVMFNALGINSREEEKSLLVLNKKIREQINLQKKQYPNYIYDYGFLYQSLNILGIFGVRNTEKRFEQYRLSELIKSSDYVLDIGCNCGFMAVYTAYRTGCRADGVDVNEYMINVGNICTDYLNLSDRVKLAAIPFQRFIPVSKYTVIFSFATHWTDDKLHRPVFDEYIERLYNLLDKDGLLLFETHCNDLGNKVFAENMERQKKFFSWDSPTLVDNDTREFYIMRKK